MAIGKGDSAEVFYTEMDSAVMAQAELDAAAIFKGLKTEEVIK